MPRSTLHISANLASLFVNRHYLLRRLTTTLFGIAGCSWFLLFLPDSIVDSSVHDSFRRGQYELYTVLLMLWGYEYRRQTSRLEWIINAAEILGKQPVNITADDARDARQLHLFEIFVKLPNSNNKYFHILFIWILLIIAVGLLARQGYILFL